MLASFLEFFAEISDEPFLRRFVAFGMPVGAGRGRIQDSFSVKSVEVFGLRLFHCDRLERLPGLSIPAFREQRQAYCEATFRIRKLRQQHLKLNKAGGMGIVGELLEICQRVSPHRIGRTGPHVNGSGIAGDHLQQIFVCNSGFHGYVLADVLQEGLSGGGAVEMHGWNVIDFDGARALFLELLDCLSGIFLWAQAENDVAGWPLIEVAEKAVEDVAFKLDAGGFFPLVENEDDAAAGDFVDKR